MTAYAIAHLRPTGMNSEIIEYIDRIQQTMDPFGGRFLVHMAEVEVVEGDWPGTVVLLSFPDVETARAWYKSPAYQEILPLRTRHIAGDIVLVDGVRAGYDPGESAAALRQGLV
jgi:uncharacterized protein (DUF1330 family)